jgi:sugar phosphate isomerase/epimerase
MALFITGLVSVAFRKFTPQEIIALVLKSGLSAIEWGGDCHVPHGDTNIARTVRQLTKDAGIKIAAYGSYYRVGHSESDGLPFEMVLDTARALDAQVVRVWAGARDSKDAPDDYFKRIAEDARRIAEFAATAGIKISFEYHGGTIANTSLSTLHLLESAGSSNLYSHWQPSVNRSPAERTESLITLLHKLTHVHVFQWQDLARLPLAAGTEEWLNYIRILSSLNGEMPLLIESVKDESEQSFLQDSTVLKEWISVVEKENKS